MLHEQTTTDDVGLDAAAHRLRVPVRSRRRIGARRPGRARRVRSRAPRRRVQHRRGVRPRARGAREGRRLARPSPTSRPTLDRAEQLRAADTLTDLDVLRLLSAKAAADSALRADDASRPSLAAARAQLGLHDGDASSSTIFRPAAAARDDARAGATARSRRARSSAPRASGSPPPRTSGRPSGSSTSPTSARSPRGSTDRPAAVPAGERGVHRSAGSTGTVGLGRAPRRRRGRAREARATLGRLLADHVNLEVRTRWLEAQAAFDSPRDRADAAAGRRGGVSPPEGEVRERRATTTDVLDAETDAARARLCSSSLGTTTTWRCRLARSVGNLPLATP